MKIPANGFTHAGKFHADDVFATALLQIVRPDIKITRGFVVPDRFDGFVYDIGFGMFDHHQEPRETRPNGAHDFDVFYDWFYLLEEFHHFISFRHTFDCLYLPCS